MQLFRPRLWERHRNGAMQPTSNGEHPPYLLSPSPRPSYSTHIALFLMTALTTAVAGMLWEGLHPLDDIARFYRGLPYAGTLLTILLFHEMGHYLTARYYGMDVTLPYFIPAPPPLFFLGTFGAFIRMRSPAQHRRGLLNVGAAGPIAGFCVALPAIVYAYATCTVVPMTPREGGLYFAEPLLLQLVSHLIVGPIPQGFALQMNSVGIAAWFGILVTVFNLLPMGQLDGGHIVYAILGRYARYITWVVMGLLVVMGFFWLGWFVWAFFGWVTSRRQPTILDQYAPLSRRSQVIAGIALVIFILCFMPVPLTISMMGE